MTAECVRCARPVEDGYACAACASRAAAQLAEIADLVPAAKDIAHGLSSRSDGAGGSGKPGSRLPLDLAATAKCDSVTGTLGGWARHVSETRGVEIPAPPAVVHAHGPVCRTRYGCDHASCGPLRDPQDPLDPDAVATRWLATHLEWMRHRPEADEFLADVEACGRIMRSVVRGPAAQRFLGPCGAPASEIDQIIDTYGEDPAVGLIANRCDGDVYGRPDAEYGSCRTCGARYRRDERQAWLDGEVRTWAFTAKDIADAHGINVKTIRSWAERGQLTHHGHDREGRPLYLVGDVLDLAAESAARRETERAKRERRAADRETEGAAA